MTIFDDDDECPNDCVGGHLRSCECSEPAWDLGDLMCRPACDGCCPNCKLSDAKRAELEASSKLRKLIA